MKNIIKRNFIFLVLSVILLSCGYNDATLRPNITYIDEQFNRLSDTGALVNKADGLYYQSEGQEILVSKSVFLFENGFNAVVGQGYFLFEGLENGERGIYTFNGEELERNKFYRKISHYKLIEGRHYFVASARDGKSVALVYSYYGELKTVVRMSIDQLGVDYQGHGKYSDITIDENGDVILAFSYTLLRVNLEDNSHKFIHQDKSGDDINFLTSWNGGVYYLSKSLYGYKDNETISFSGSSHFDKILDSNENYIALSGGGYISIIDSSDSVTNHSHEGSFAELFFNHNDEYVIVTTISGVFGIYRGDSSGNALELVEELHSPSLIKQLNFKNGILTVVTNNNLPKSYDVF